MRRELEVYVATAGSLDVLDGASTPSIVLVFEVRSTTPFSRRCVGATPWGRAILSSHFSAPTDGSNAEPLT